MFPVHQEALTLRLCEQASELTLGKVCLIYRGDRVQLAGFPKW